MSSMYLPYFRRQSMCGRDPAKNEDVTEQTRLPRITVAIS
jgi:hypothetical protein